MGNHTGGAARAEANRFYVNVDSITTGRAVQFVRAAAALEAERCRATTLGSLKAARSRKEVRFIRKKTSSRNRGGAEAAERIPPSFIVFAFPLFRASAILR